MKYTILPLLLSCCLLQAKHCMAQTTKKANSLVGVFDGRTPCKDLAKQINEKVTSECIKIKWRLILYKDSITGDPGTYKLLGFIYKKDNPRTGKWRIIKGTKISPEAIVYQLDQPGREPLFLQQVDENIFFFLDQEKKLMVGNRDFSYTLNRVAKNL